MNYRVIFNVFKAVLIAEILCIGYLPFYTEFLMHSTYYDYKPEGAVPPQYDLATGKLSAEQNGPLWIPEKYVPLPGIILYKLRDVAFETGFILLFITIILIIPFLIIFRRGLNPKILTSIISLQILALVLAHFLIAYCF